MSATPRVALFADTFHEVNGAARTCREWHAFARRRRIPFLCVRFGAGRGVAEEGPVRTLELARSRWAFRVDPDLRFDPCLMRLIEPIEAETRRFHPDYIHVTSPGDLGIIGAIVAAKLRTPLAASWHTNLHEFAARRVTRMLGWVPRGLRSAAARTVEDFVMDRVCWFFGRASVIFAPNRELEALLRERTGKPVFPMRRGIDTELFHPSRRTRSDDSLVVGYVGRLMPEKSVRLLARVEAALRAAGLSNVRFQITGSGSERRWLERNLPSAVLTGVLHGEDLARAYAGMDIFAFPSRTDTFGNVVQEALASGVPAVVTDAGGPRFIVRDAETGFVASSDDEFCDCVVALARDESLRRRMGAAARRQVEKHSWDWVFDEVYEGYAGSLVSAC
jgi:glycosyltransferase involved in cell wall biosynthesis